MVRRTRGTTARNAMEILAIISVFTAVSVACGIWALVWNSHQSSTENALQLKLNNLMDNFTDLLVISTQQEQEIDQLMQNITQQADEIDILMQNITQLANMPGSEPTEFQQVQLASNFVLSAAGPADEFYDIPGMELTVDPGRYWLEYAMHVSVSSSGLVQMQIWDIANNLICAGSIGLSSNGGQSDISRGAFIDINATATYNVVARRSSGATATIIAVDASSGMTNPDVSAVFHAIKLP